MTTVQSIINLLCWSHISWVIVHIEPSSIEGNVTKLIILNTIKVIVSDVLSWLDVSELNVQGLEVAWAIDLVHVLSQFRLHNVSWELLLDEDVSVWDVELPGGGSGDEKSRFHFSVN